MLSMYIWEIEIPLIRNKSNFKQDYSTKYIAVPFLYCLSNNLEDPKFVLCTLKELINIKNASSKHIFNKNFLVIVNLGSLF